MAQIVNPVLRGIQFADERYQNEQQNELKGILGQLQIQGALQKQQQDLAYRGALSNAKTPEDAARVAAQFGTPKDVLTHFDALTRVDANKQMALARLDDNRKRFYDNLELRRKLGEDALSLRRDAEAFDQQDKNRRASLGEAAGAYNFNFVPGPAITPTVTANPPGPGYTPIPQEQPGAGSGLQPQPSPALAPRPSVPRATSQPEGEPIDIPSVLPDSPAAMSMRYSGGLEGRHPEIVAGAPVAPNQTPLPVPLLPNNQNPKGTLVTPSKPEMPTFYGSPSQIAQKKNEWLMAQGKAQLKADVQLAGGRESMMINRVIAAGNQASRDLENVSKLPMTASRGYFGGRGQAEGILNAGKETLTNQMTTQEVQTYNVLATGFQRTLAAIETSGLGVTNALMHQMDGVIFKEGDTNLTKLHKLAQTRQIVEAGLETVIANPRVAQETKDHVKTILERVIKSIPFTQADLLSLEQAQKDNPKITLGDVIKQKTSSVSKNAKGWKLMQDAKGNRAYVGPNGEVEEVK